MAIASLALLSLPTMLQGQHYKETNLVSNVPGVAATTDLNLVNAWGVSRGTTTPWWVSDNGTGLTTLYTGTGSIVPLVVTIPAADSGSGTPTGQIFNGTQDFQLTPGNPARFLFVTEDGTVSGWNPAVSPKTAVIKVNTHSASVFKGMAVATVDDSHGGSANFLYVADFRKGRVNVYDTNFHLISMHDDDAFRDGKVPHGFAPFNIQNIGGNLYVAWAKQDGAKHDEVDGAGLGFVSVFSPTGRLLHRLQWTKWFNAPWGIAQAPSDFGIYSHDILVGQFGSGQILAFDPVTGALKGTLNDASNNPITINGLWGISFGSGGSSGPATTLYFAAGLNDEQDGLVGSITAIENTLGGDI
ncbi:TIGR03118 family protein [Occallatibacter savannae]|uniref:TIGR03118 family protein n=1 Tax=Occallatibacter savannae TaxID=1002691 RepID=UPI0013A552F1|nr:TIGR03118 family protein [Occallatibacter savannae]